MYWRPSTILSIASSAGLGKVMCKCDLYPLSLYYWWKTLFPFRVSLLQSSSSYASLDIVGECKTKISITSILSYHPCNRHCCTIFTAITTATVLKHAETLSIQITFKRVIVWNGMIRDHINLMICLTVLIFLFFFPQKCIIFFFSFAHFFNKVVKPKWKTMFTKYLKGYICYIFLI